MGRPSITEWREGGKGESARRVAAENEPNGACAAKYRRPLSSEASRPLPGSLRWTRPFPCPPPGSAGPTPVGGGGGNGGRTLRGPAPTRMRERPDGTRRARPFDDTRLSASRGYPDGYVSPREYGRRASRVPVGRGRPAGGRVGTSYADAAMTESGAAVVRKPPLSPRKFFAMLYETDAADTGRSRAATASPPPGSPSPVRSAAVPPAEPVPRQAVVAVVRPAVAYVEHHTFAAGLSAFRKYAAIRARSNRAESGAMWESAFRNVHP